MGYRIKRSIGWGMPWAQFVEQCRAPDTNDISEWLYDTFNALTDEDLTIDPKLYRALFCDDGASFVFQKRLLATDYEDLKTTSKIDRAENLFSITFDGDDYGDIVFYPNLCFRKRWYRSDDDMDYAFESIRGDQGEPGESEEGFGPRNFTVYKTFGHYPWANYIMDHNGKTVPWEHYQLLRRRDDWAPGIPTEIRWYLTQHGIMFNEGVNQLRPIVTQWWS